MTKIPYLTDEQKINNFNDRQKMISDLVDFLISSTNEQRSDDALDKYFELTECLTDDEFTVLCQEFQHCVNVGMKQ